MISGMIAATSAESAASTNRQSAASSPVIAANAPPDGADFSSAMANAAAPTPKPDTEAGSAAATAAVPSGGGDDTPEASTAIPAAPQSPSRLASSAARSSTSGPAGRSGAASAQQRTGAGNSPATAPGAGSKATSKQAAEHGAPAGSNPSDTPAGKSTKTLNANDEAHASTAVSADSRPSAPNANPSCTVADTTPAATAAMAAPAGALDSLAAAQRTLASPGTLGADAAGTAERNASAGLQATHSSERTLSAQTADVDSAEPAGRSLAEDGDATVSSALAASTAEAARNSAAGALPGFSSLFGAASTTEGTSADKGGSLTWADPVAATSDPSAALPASVLASLPGGPGGSGVAAALGQTVLHVGTTVGEPGFAQDISRQLVYLARTGTQSAELSLRPENLGPVSVSIQMNGLEASLAISAGHEATRAALRDALPHLNELFQSSGLQLTGAQVGDGSQRDPDKGTGQQSPAGGSGGSGSQILTPPLSVTLAPVAGRSAGSARLIDTFA